MSTPEKPASEEARRLARSDAPIARIYATLAIADAIRQAGTSIGSAMVEAARIRAGHRR